MAQGVAGLRSMLGASKRRRSAHGGAQTYQDSSALRRRRTTAERGITARLAKREVDAGRTKVRTFDHAKTFLDMKLHVRLRPLLYRLLAHLLARARARGLSYASVVALSAVGVWLLAADTRRDSPIQAEFDTHDEINAARKLAFLRKRSKVVEVVAAQDLIFALTRTGVCAVFSRGAFA